MPFIYAVAVAPPQNANPMQFSYSSVIDPQDQPCIDAGLAVFNNILTEDLPAANYNGDANFRGIDVDVSVNQDLAGTQTIAQAAPTQLRSNPQLALAGIIEINPDFLPSGGGQFASCDLLTRSMVHEIFHIVSMNSFYFVPNFGSMGNCGPDGNSETADDSANGKYTGPIALAAYRTAIGNPAAPHIPMTCQSAHWLEDDRFGDQGLTTELMTPFADTPSPLAYHTIATLEDLGYPGVAYTEAETWP